MLAITQRPYPGCSFLRHRLVHPAFLAKREPLYRHDIPRRNVSLPLSTVNPGMRQLQGLKTRVVMACSKLMPEGLTASAPKRPMLALA
jgi:hypothetical protein